MFEGVAGFRPDPADPGFRTIVFEPTIIPELSPVRASHDSQAGTVRAAWTVDGKHVRYEVTVPLGARGLLRLNRAHNITIDGVSSTAGERELRPGDHVIIFDHEPAERLDARGLDINARTP